MICVADCTRCVDENIAVFLGAFFHRSVCHIDNQLTEVEPLSAGFTCRRIIFVLDTVVKHTDNHQLNIGVESINIFDNMIPVFKEVFKAVFQCLRENFYKFGH